MIYKHILLHKWNRVWTHNAIQGIHAVYNGSYRMTDVCDISTS